MPKNTIFFDEKTVEASKFLSEFEKEGSEDILDVFFQTLKDVNKEKRLFSDALRSYYVNYLKSSKAEINETDEIKGLFSLLEKTSEGTDSKYRISQRTVRNWFTYPDYSMTKQSSKIAFFQVAFALGLCHEEVKTFFMRLFGGVPAFSRNPVDLIFEYNFINGLTFKNAVSMLENYEKQTSSEYENAFKSAYSEDNINYTHFYASAINCNGSCLSLFDYLVNSVEDTEKTEEFLINNDLSPYLSSLILKYENESGSELNRKTLEETASMLVSSKGLENKYIRRESKDNTRVKSWREGKGTPELTDSFSDRVLMYALIKVLKLNKTQISNLILLSAKSKAKRFSANDNNNESIIESIKCYIEAKKDSSLPAACAEDIEIFSFLYSGKKIDINSEKDSFLNTHGNNSIEELFGNEPNDFIKELIKNRLEFSVNNVRAKEHAAKYIKYLAETKTAEKYLISLLEKMRFHEYIDSYIYSLKSDFWKNILSKYIKETLSSGTEDLSVSFFPWFWVSVTYGFGNSMAIARLFQNAANAATKELEKEPWFKLNTGNKFYKEWLVNEYNISYSDFQKSSEFFMRDSSYWRQYVDIVSQSNNSINVKKHEDISTFKNTVAEEAFISCCNREILNLYKKDISSVFKEIESDEETEDYKRFLCSAFKSMPSPSFISGNHFEAGKGNMNLYEQLRSLLIFLHFFTYFKGKGKTFKDYRFEIDTLLSECGFSKLYSKEPLDFVFLICAQSASPVKSFSILWNLALSK